MNTPRNSEEPTNQARGQDFFVSGRWLSPLDGLNIVIPQFGTLAGAANSDLGFRIWAKMNAVLAGS